MNREFYADRPNEKWLTDVTAFKYYDGPVIKKLYLSAFLDLYDRRIVAYKPVVLGYLIYQTVSGKLSWSHYCELLSITDENKRSFYEKESINSGWSVRELKRQIDSSLYERLLLSSGDVNKEKVLSLAQKGIEINQPADIIRDPYVFEFLGVPENKPILESDLEKALVVQIEKFLLELGRGASCLLEPSSA